MYKIEFKEIFFKLVTNDQSDKVVSVDIIISSPRGCLPPPQGYIHV